jgi:hypothetical protein
MHMQKWEAELYASLTWAQDECDATAILPQQKELLIPIR